MTADVTSGIIRNPTEKDKNFRGDDGESVKEWIGDSKTDVKHQFDVKLNEESQKAMKKGLPFCDRAARDDFNDGYKDQIEKSTRKNGYVVVDEIKPVKINWNKYSDLTNFEILEEGETPDEYLTKKHPGLDVRIKKVVYRFKGYSNKYTVMEEPSLAIQRAKKAVA